MKFDYSKFMGRDLLELEEQVGWDINKLEHALNGAPATNAIGGPIYEMNGDKPVLDGGGKPMIARVLTTKTLMVMVWMCVRRAAPDVQWKTFDFNVAGAEFDPEDEEAGKGSTAAPSKRSTTSTKPRSRRSSASPRGTSGRS